MAAATPSPRAAARWLSRPQTVKRLRLSPVNSSAPSRAGSGTLIERTLPRPDPAGSEGCVPRSISHGPQASAALGARTRPAERPEGGPESNQAVDHRGAAAAAAVLGRGNEILPVALRKDIVRRPEPNRGFPDRPRRQRNLKLPVAAPDSAGNRRHSSMTENSSADSQSERENVDGDQAGTAQPNRHRRAGLDRPVPLANFTINDRLSGRRGMAVADHNGPRPAEFFQRCFDIGRLAQKAERSPNTDREDTRQAKVVSRRSSSFPPECTASLAAEAIIKAGTRKYWSPSVR